MKLTLAERCLIGRKRMGLTQTELGQVLGVKRRTIYRIEVGLTVSKATVSRFEIWEGRHIKTSKGKGKVQVPA